MNLKQFYHWTSRCFWYYFSFSHTHIYKEHKVNELHSRLLHSRHLPQLDCLHRMSYNVVSPDFQFRISAFVVWTGFICISAVMFYFSVLLLSTVCSFCSYFGCYFGLFMTLVLFLYFGLFFVFWI